MCGRPNLGVIRPPGFSRRNSQCHMGAKPKGLGHVDIDIDLRKRWKSQIDCYLIGEPNLEPLVPLTERTR